MIARNLDSWGSIGWNLDSNDSPPWNVESIVHDLRTQTPYSWNVCMHPGIFSMIRANICVFFYYLQEKSQAMNFLPREIPSTGFPATRNPKQWISCEQSHAVDFSLQEIPRIQFLATRKNPSNGFLAARNPKQWISRHSKSYAL